METSAVCVSHLPSSSSIFSSPFSDQSHVHFYHYCPSSPSLPFPSLRSSQPRPLRIRCESACSPPPLHDPASDQNSLMKELAELKMQLKQKKKELKSQMKDGKKKLKMQMREGKKAMKQKDCTGGKKKMKCESESSSSSESSDEDCESVSMGMLQQEQALVCDSEDLSVRVYMEENALISDQGSSASATSPSVTEAMCSSTNYEESLSSSRQKMMETFDGDVGPTLRESSVQESVQRLAASALRGLALTSSLRPAANRIEVCAGGKCKKAGSEQLSLALGAQISSSSDVVVASCKCMGKCSMAMNVRVHKEDTNPQHHGHVRVEDANLILNHHFGLGRPPTGLPTLLPLERPRAPLSMSA